MKCIAVFAVSLGIGAGILHPASADNSYASSSKGFSGNSYAKSARPQNAGQTMYSSSGSGGGQSYASGSSYSTGNSYATGGSYSGSSYARTSTVGSQHVQLGKSTNGSLLNQMRGSAQPVQTNFNSLSRTTNGSTGSSLLSIMGRSGGARQSAPQFVRTPSSYGKPAAAAQNRATKTSSVQSTAGAAKGAAPNAVPAQDGGSVLSRIRKKRG